MNPTNHTNDPRPVLDDSDHRIERALDALGQSERDAAPTSLESRAFAASIESLRAANAPPGAIAGRIAPNAARGAASQSRRRFAIAAGLGAMVCAGGLWLALRGNSASPSGFDTGPRVARSTPSQPADTGLSTDAELEAMLLASSMLATGMDDEIESISASAASLGLSLTDPIGDQWSDPLWTGESL